MRRSGSIDRVDLADGTTAFRARLHRGGQKVLDARLPTRSLAEQAIELILAGGTIGLPQKNGLTMGKLLEDWLQLREEHGLVRGIRKERSCFRANVAESSLMEEAVGQVSRRHIKAFVMELFLDPKSPSPQTVKHALRLVRGALEWALDEEWVESNPARGVKVPKRQQEPSWTFLSNVEVQALLDAPVPLKQRALFTTALFTGLRKGELLGLRWGDVKLDSAHACVIVRASHGGPTKSMRVREVPLLQPAIESLRAYRLEQPGLPNAHVFRRGSGGRHDESYDGGWRRVWCSRILGRHVRFHDLRHSCASSLLSGSWSPTWLSRPLRLEEVREWLGHSTISVTLRYAHLSPDSLRNLVKRSSAQEGGSESLKTRTGESARSPAHTPSPWLSTQEMK